METSFKYDAAKLADLGYGDACDGRDSVTMTWRDVICLAKCFEGQTEQSFAEMVAEIETARID